MHVEINVVDYASNIPGKYFKAGTTIFGAPRSQVADCHCCGASKNIMNQSTVTVANVEHHWNHAQGTDWQGWDGM